MSPLVRGRAHGGEGRRAPRGADPRRRAGDGVPRRRRAGAGGRGPRGQHPRRGLRRRRRRDRRRRRGGVGAGRDGREGQGAAGVGVRATCATTSRCSPTCTWPPTRRSPRPCCDAGTTGVAYETVMRADGALPLLAPMSEVAGRLAVQAGARFLEAPQGGRGVLLGGAPGVQPARVVVIGAGNVGLELGVDRGRHGGGGQPPRQEPRSPALRRPDPQGPHHHPGLQPRHGRALHRRGRPRDRRRARGRRPGPGRDHRAHGRDDEAGRGDRRRRHRPGRLRGDVPRDDPPRPHLRRARRRPLLRGQHARRGAGHVHPRAHQRHPPVPRRGGRARRHRGLPAGSGARARAQHRGRPGRQRGRRRGARPSGGHASHGIA